MLKKIVLATALCSAASFASAEGATAPTLTLSTQSAPLLAGLGGASIGSAVFGALLLTVVADAASNGT